MSAWVVERQHIDVLLRYGLSTPSDRVGWFAGGEFKQLTYENATQVGLMLAQENVASVCHRYESDSADLYDEILQYEYRDPGYTLSHGEVLQAIACFEYQACEHNDWEASEAHAFCESLFRRAAMKFADGPWGWDEAELARRPKSWPLFRV